MLNRLRGLCLLILCILLLPVTASAQTTARATLSSLNTDAFPRIEAYLDVQDAEGKFIHGLQAEDIRVVENGRQLPVVEISEQRPGVQVVVALNPGQTFAVRNSQGISRYDFLVDAFGKWAKSRQGSTLDDWSLLTTNGPEISHVSDPMVWFSAVLTETISVKEDTLSLDTLFRAVDIAADPTARPGMGRAVLFVTPPIEGQVALSLENISAQAQQQGVRVNIWMIAPPAAPITEAGEKLIELANHTGGQFATFSGEESVPDPESFLAPLRNIYRLVYESQATGSEPHQVVVEIQTEDETISTPAQAFNFDVQPPNPAFVSPVLEIKRKPPERRTMPGSEILIEDFIPADQNLQVLIDFPDGRVRPLASTALYVDGVLVAENTAPPFDQFTWDLRSYTTNEQHLLRVEARDSLGLVGSSIETMVKVVIDLPQKNLWTSLYQHTPVLAGLLVVLAGSVLLLVLLIGGRIRPPRMGTGKPKRRKSDPVTQPVPVKNEPAARRFPGWVNRLQWPQRHVIPKAYAFLARITETEGSHTPPPVPITAEEITLGSDSNQATLVLNDPSVEALHARLLRTEDGSFRLADEGSIAGTWINYTPVSHEGTNLEHGDLVHIGRIGFRFTLRQPGKVRKPIITTVTAAASKTTNKVKTAARGKPQKEIRP